MQWTLGMFALLVIVDHTAVNVGIEISGKPLLVPFCVHLEVGLQSRRYSMFAASQHMVSRILFCNSPERQAFSSLLWLKRDLPKQETDQLECLPKGLGQPGVS